MKTQNREENMMFKKMSVLICGAFLTALPVAAEETGPYVGVQYVAGSFDDGQGSKASPKNLMVRGGFAFMPNFAIEARYGIALGDAPLSDQPINIKFDVLGAYAIGKLPLGDMFDVYAVLGQSQITATVSGYGQSDTQKKNGMSYGIGGDYRFSERLSAGIEYMSYYAKDGVKLTALSAGIGWKF